MCVSKATTPAGHRLPLPFTDGKPSNHWWTGYRVNCRGMDGWSWRWQAGRRMSLCLIHPLMGQRREQDSRSVCLVIHCQIHPMLLKINTFASASRRLGCARSGVCECVYVCMQMCVRSCLCAHMCLSRVETGALASTSADASRIYLSEDNIKIGRYMQPSAQNDCWLSVCFWVSFRRHTRS